MLVIGTKLDLIGESRIRMLKRSSLICDEYGADEIFLVILNIYIYILTISYVILNINEQ